MADEHTRTKGLGSTAGGTLDFYARNAGSYAAGSRGNARLRGFLQFLPAGSLILELGTGSGIDARTMLDLGYRVDPTDGSPELAAEAEKRLGRPVRRMLFSELDAEKRYDGVYACASLLHADRRDLPDLIARIHLALKAGGVVWASFKGGEREGCDSLGRYFNYLGPGELEALWRSSGDWSDIRVESWSGSAYDGVATDWHAILARKR
ncbi:class I SAM-dependent methyltransferase [Rhizobiaceae bacterium n13]|uniref:Class I SAM-dependent methyltransferase n=1 Tax=Ferirhizobium litorale TaxID=2927786 RepID=A0AAE3U2L6_9HYPH|nr:class I SAM-dependent methyltransferase [Fererhizobium litorale]MDI7863919.1 class I SAM-dependent methyltransferase [Fererhizobium litorale]MDI7924249.1 class I SAM-dependent methyltransferase [Fererhizobium litorale]